MKSTLKTLAIYIATLAFTCLSAVAIAALPAAPAVAAFTGVACIAVAIVFAAAC